jgi:hypothetical protein
MQEKLNQLSLGEKLLLGGAVVIFIASFFNWAEASVTVAGFGTQSDGGSGWSSPGSLWSVLAILIAVILAGALAALRFGDVTLPALPSGVSWGMVYAAGAALVILFMLLKAWRISALPGCGDAGDLDGFDCSVGFAIGYWIALIGAVIFAAGGYMLYTADKGEGFGGLRSRMQQ